MQILMGVNSTNIIIDESKVYTRNLTNFIYSNFSSSIIYKDTLTLNYTENEHFSRIFLIKWLYSLYTNITKNNFVNMKEILLKRIEKPIKIKFKNRTPKKISITIDIIDDEELHIYFTEYIDFAIMAELKSILITSDEIIKNSSKSFINIFINNENTKANIKNIIKLKKLNDQNISYIYDSKKLHKILECIPKTSPYSDALILLDVDEKEDIKFIEKRYKNLLRKYHPDKVHSRDEEKILDYTEKFKSIQNAFCIIKSSKVA
ncbi:MAG: DnaJ domain-containing protein [Sulfurimonas sp.]|nr:DnaJ domain-containing protein [Sulfurimonas sp.]